MQTGKANSRKEGISVNYQTRNLIFFKAAIYKQLSFQPSSQWEEEDNKTYNSIHSGYCEIHELFLEVIQCQVIIIIKAPQYGFLDHKNQLHFVNILSELFLQYLTRLGGTHAI